MINKFSEEIQKEIEGILNKIQVWNALFNIKLEFYQGFRATYEDSHFRILGI